MSIFSYSLPGLSLPSHPLPSPSWARSQLSAGTGAINQKHDAASCRRNVRLVRERTVCCGWKAGLNVAVHILLPPPKNGTPKCEAQESARDPEEVVIQPIDATEMKNCQGEA
ncbi:hypothetical protein GCM10022280_02280 [Sphingomonas swuensis]|uniref:Uncharacterized protein n=1 Tax=Sphingomonas swuensis TaxID=977800 RepID=A0ABP7SAF8_9SPHN